MSKTTLLFFLLFFISNCKQKLDIPEGEKKPKITDLNVLLSGEGKSSGENRVTPVYNFGVFKVSIVISYSEMTIHEKNYPVVGLMVLNGTAGLKFDEGTIPVERGKFFSFPPIPMIQIQPVQSKRSNLLLFQSYDFWSDIPSN